MSDLSDKLVKAALDAILTADRDFRPVADAAVVAVLRVLEKHYDEELTHLGAINSDVLADLDRLAREIAAIIIDRAEAERLAKLATPQSPEVVGISKGGSGIELELSDGRTAHFCFSDEVSYIISRLKAIEPLWSGGAPSGATREEIARVASDCPEGDNWEPSADYYAAADRLLSRFTITRKDG